jgi:hypothetical protein
MTGEFVRPEGFDPPTLRFNVSSNSDTESNPATKAKYENCVQLSCHTLAVSVNQENVAK